MRLRLLSCCLLLSVITALAQENPNFSGTYALTALKGEHTAKTLPKSTMKVAQSGGSIEIVESFDDGKTLTRKYALDGSESKNLTSGGVPTTDRAEIKGKTLVIRSSYRLLTGDTIHETEKWELSADSKTIKIRLQTHYERMSMLDDTLTRLTSDSRVSSLVSRIGVEKSASHQLSQIEKASDNPCSQLS